MNRRVRRRGAVMGIVVGLVLGFVIVGGATRLAAQSIAAPLLATAAQPAAAPFLAYLQQGDVWVVRADGSDRRQMTQSGTGEWIEWSPRGDSLLLSTQVRTTPPGRSQEMDVAAGLYVVGLDGSTPRQVDAGARTTATQRRGAWAPDGTRVAFVDGDSVIVADPSGSEGRRYVITLPASTLTDLNAPGLTLHTPTFFPDGQALLVPTAAGSETGPGGDARIRFYRLTLSSAAVDAVAADAPVLHGRLPEQLAFAPGNQAFSFLSSHYRSTCEQTGYFARVDPSSGGLLAYEALTGAQPELRRFAPGERIGQPGWGIYPGGYAWAPDGRSLAVAFTYQECPPRGPGSGFPQAHLFVGGVDGALQSTGRGIQPAWAPTGDLLAYVTDESPPNLRVRELGSSREQTLGPGVRPAWQPLGLAPPQGAR